jgi:hypothetical protein
MEGSAGVQIYTGVRGAPVAMRPRRRPYTRSRRGAGRSRAPCVALHRSWRDGHERGAIAGEAGDAMEARGVDGVSQGQRRQNGGESPRQPRRASPRGRGRGDDGQNACRKFRFILAAEGVEGHRRCPVVAPTTRAAVPQPFPHGQAAPLCGPPEVVCQLSRSCGARPCRCEGSGGPAASPGTAHRCPTAGQGRPLCTAQTPHRVPLLCRVNG